MDVRAFAAVILLCGLVRAEGEGPAPSRTPLDLIRSGLTSPALSARNAAESAARELARTDPAGVAALFGALDLRGRCALVRALAGAGTKRAATIALKHIADPDQELFHALMDGLARGGAKALSAPLPAATPAARRKAVEELRQRWKVEGELVRLKSPSGLTGHYTGQFDRVRELGPSAVSVLFDIMTDRYRPFSSAGGAGPYEPIHPGMVRYEPEELRQMTANAFGQILDSKDDATREVIVRLLETFERYWAMDDRTHPFEKTELASHIAFSLFDLGLREPANRYVKWLEDRERGSLRASERLLASWELGFVYIRLGRYEEGEAKYQAVLDYSGISKHIAAYNLACNFSVRSRQEPAQVEDYRERALTYLELAVRLHFADWRWMAEDRDLDAIRDDPRYKRVLSELKLSYPGRKKHRVAKKFDEILVEPGK